MNANDLHPGDVLLFHGTALYRQIIQALEGSPYSHAGLFDGEHSVEALGNGVTARHICRSLRNSPYADVFRWVGPAGQHLGEEAFPVEPVLERAAWYVRSGNRYAYEDILLLALLSPARQAGEAIGGASLNARLDVGGIALKIEMDVAEINRLLREAEDEAAATVARWAQLGRQALLCSEAVYRCFAEAGDGRYRLAIADKPGGGADLVTPADLARSPSLERVGRLAGSVEPLLAMPELAGPG